MLATQLKKTTIDLGFVGVGWIGRNRMEAILEHTNARAAAIVEPLAENAQAALEHVNSARLAEDPEELFADQSLEGIVIATPSAMHAEQSIRALDSGKAVFCQKPLGRTAKEVREVISASRKADKLLAVDFSYRYTRAFNSLHNLIKNGHIGDVYAVDLVFHNAYGPDKAWFYDIKKSGGGCVMDLGIHLVDLALWTLGFPEISELRSNLFKNGKRLTGSDQQVEDYASVTMTSENDQVINLDCSWNVSAGKDAVIEAKFYGTKGGAAFKNINGSFYDFTAEKYLGTKTELLMDPPDNWGGRAGVAWVEKLMKGNHFDDKSAEELLKTAEIIDRIYER